VSRPHKPYNAIGKFLFGCRFRSSSSKLLCTQLFDNQPDLLKTILAIPKEEHEKAGISYTDNGLRVLISRFMTQDRSTLPCGLFNLVTLAIRHKYKDKPAFADCIVRKFSERHAPPLQTPSMVTDEMRTAASEVLYDSDFPSNLSREIERNPSVAREILGRLSGKQESAPGPWDRVLATIVVPGKAASIGRALRILGAE
jgi:hypothetical protein